MAFDFDGISLQGFPELEEAAEKELGETPERRTEARAGRIGIVIAPAGLPAPPRARL